MMIEIQIFLVVCLERNHHAVLFRIVNRLFHQRNSNAVVLHLRIDCQIDDVKALILVQLVCPAGVEVVISLQKVLKCFERVIFLD